MTANMQQTVGELAFEVPGATRIFETAGIDYCCGGKRSLRAACEMAGVDPETMLASLAAREAATPRRPGEGLAGYSLEQLIEHIVGKHHAFTVRELVRLEGLLGKVRGKHESAHPELADVGYAFALLFVDLMPHMQKEERILFPYIVAMERAAAAGAPAPPAPFGTVRNPITAMMAEHDTAGDLLAEIRAATANFELPEGACASFHALYEGLKDLERDLHEHIHLENTVLFPRAAELERK